MKRVAMIILAAGMLAGLCACGTGAHGAAEPAPTAALSATMPPASTPAPEPAEEQQPGDTPEPRVLWLPETPADWAEDYLAFLDDNYDIFAALWPEGLAGVGFVDLDLDGMPEMAVFDQGASATLGVQLFDQIDGKVYCVSSVLESAAGAFDNRYYSRTSICASYLESFRLAETEEGYCFWVSSANGTMESSWDEIVRFDSADGVLTPMSVCGRNLVIDEETGELASEDYTVEGEPAGAEEYAAAAAAYTDARDTGYEAKGVFLWNDMSSYDTNYDGLMAMARDAVSGYVPIGLNQ